MTTLRFWGGVVQREEEGVRPSVPQRSSSLVSALLPAGFSLLSDVVEAIFHCVFSRVFCSLDELI